jgi:hypothetical protein
MSQYFDGVGKEVKVGDYVVYSSGARESVLRIGKVLYLGMNEIGLAGAYLTNREPVKMRKIKKRFYSCDFMVVDINQIENDKVKRVLESL